MEYERQFANLNEYQKAAVLAESRACLVNANVGSGKTTVLIAKIIYLHEVKQVAYQDMVVLTFTNKAADEIKERLLRLEPGLSERSLTGFGTFHSVALELLKNTLPVERLGYSQDFLVIDPDEEIALANDLIADEKLKIKYKNRLKKRLEQVATVKSADQRGARYQDDICLLADLLTQEKRRQNKMTFSDLLKVSCKLLAEKPIQPKWIIIDEVQDSDLLQLEFIDCLYGPETRLFAVGDPNQMIYSWRGSALNVFYTLKNRYQAEELSLPVNYRSSAAILDAAKCFLQNSSPLEGVKEPGSKIIVKNHYNSFQEADYLAGRIKEIHESGLPYREIAIFYRLQSQSKVLEDVFARAEIPYEVSLKKTVHDMPVLSWLLKLLRFCLNQKDTAAGAEVLSNKDYGVKITNKKARKLVCEQPQTMPGLLLKMLQFPAVCSSLKDASDIFEYFGLSQCLRPTAASYQADYEAVMDFLATAVNYAEDCRMDLLQGLREFLNTASLYGLPVFHKSVQPAADAVKLMTLHASKGLEFSKVFIIGVNYGLIPLQTKGFEGEDEERRLFFVGITRAKDELELSYYTSPEYHRAVPGASRFITMLPPHLVHNDADRSETVNLAELKRAVQAQKQLAEPQPPVEENLGEQRVRHSKYGLGLIIGEEDELIMVKFEDYGEKEFVKIFSNLEYL